MDVTTAFELGGKSLAPPVQTERGDVLISGYAAVWDGLDFQQENFLRGAFKDAIPEFLNGQATLAFEHQTQKGIGRVLELAEDDIGVRFKALVHRQEKSSPLYYIYDAVRRGIYRGVSVGGFFSRAMTAAGMRIARVRLTDVSLTPRAMHPGTWASAVEVKSFAGAADPLAELDRTVSLARLAVAAREAEITQLRLEVARL